MTSAVRQLKRKAAKRPSQRTVSVILDGEFAGWEATARADWPARWMEDLDPEDVPRFMSFLDRIILSHNMPNADDEIADSMMDVDPYEGVVRMGEAIIDAIGKLPKR